MTMTPRQQVLLKAIIEEFIETATAVGSLNIPQKYNIDASPATIRNEMAKLVSEGFLKKMHSSSGRLPTTAGLKYYLQELLSELEDIDHSDEVSLREELHQNRYNKNLFVQRAVKSLSSLTGNTAVILLNNHIYYSGLSEILDSPELREMLKLKKLLNIIEDYSVLFDLFESYRGDKDIKVLIGEETGIEGLDDFAVVFTPIRFYGDTEGYISIVGPYRMSYSRVIPAVKFVANTIEHSIRGW